MQSHTLMISQEFIRQKGPNDMLKKLAVATFAFVTAFSTIEIGANYFATGELGIGRPVEARVGRPLTPVSVAGAGRRTVRRCAAGVYNC